MSEELSLAFEQEVADLVDEVVQETTGRSVHVGSEDRLIQDGYLDSFSMVSLVLTVQTRYGIPVDVADIDEEHFGTVPRIARFITASRPGACDIACTA